MLETLLINIDLNVLQEMIFWLIPSTGKLGFRKGISLLKFAVPGVYIGPKEKTSGDIQ
jgi:hypothetical protein